MERGGNIPRRRGAWWLEDEVRDERRRPGGGVNVTQRRVTVILVTEVLSSCDLIGATYKHLHDKLQVGRQYHVVTGLSSVLNAVYNCTV